MSDIPIRNLYYLLCYAWNRLEQGKIIAVARIPTTSVADLFAAVLCSGVEHIARRGMQQGYQPRVEEVSSLRGRIDVLSSSRRHLLLHGRAICSFADLSVDTLANRILKATLKLLKDRVDDKGLRQRVRALYSRLSSISDLRLTRQVFKSIQLGSHERFYRFLMRICELVLGSWLVESGTGSSRFRDFRRDERAMTRVFEDFIYNFLRLEQSQWRVSRERIPWAASSTTDPTLRLLPEMRTDVVLRQANSCRIIDAKYYQKALSHRYDTDKFHSANLYQLMSYVSHESARNASQEISGMLLYPRVDRTLRERYLIQGHVIDLCTIDLNADWQEIEAEIRALFR